ncbi:diguanylate cyclase [Geomonas sp. Red276]
MEGGKGTTRKKRGTVTELAAGARQRDRQISHADRPLPIIVVTENEEEKVAWEALKRGTPGYLPGDLEIGDPETASGTLDRLLQELLADQALAALRESEERHRRIVELSHDGILICSGSRIEFANPAAGRLLLGEGASGTLLGASLLDFLSPATKAAFRAQLAHIEKSGLELTWVEDRFIRSDGQEVAVEVAAVPFSTAAGRSVQITFRDITERVRAKELLERLAYYDQLTSLPNRALFADRLEINLAQARRYGFPFAVLYLDLDGFKEINDTMGHAMGDRLLMDVAARLRHCTRGSDTVARLGGDEFIILMSRIREPSDAALVARKLLVSLSGKFVLAGQPCRIGVSIGISLYPTDTEDAEELMKNADIAMYGAKQKGGNHYLYYHQLSGPPP